MYIYAFKYLSFFNLSCFLLERKKKKGQGSRGVCSRLRITQERRVLSSSPFAEYLNRRNWAIVTYAHPLGSTRRWRERKKKKRKEKRRKKERQRERARRFRERERMSRFSLFTSTRRSGKTCCCNKRATCKREQDSRKARSAEKRKCQLGRVVSLLFSFLCFIADLARNKIAWKRSVAKHSNVEFLTLTPNWRLLLSTARKEWNSVERN